MAAMAPSTKANGGDPFNALHAQLSSSDLPARDWLQSYTHHCAWCEVRGINCLVSRRQTKVFHAVSASCTALEP
jgi:hypothetical protein